MIKVFISQPMNGKTNEEIELERERARQAIKEKRKDDVEVIDSFFKGGNHTPLWCLGESIKLLGTADVVYFAKGWEKARGCCIEHACAYEYGVPIMEEEPILKMVARK